MSDNKDLKVAVIIISENSEEAALENILTNVLEQTYPIDIYISSFIQDDTVKNKLLSKGLNIIWDNADPKTKFLDELLNKLKHTYNYIFYKTVSNQVTWYPRHVQAHIENYKKDSNKWSLSHIEYRDVDQEDNGYNCAGFRISNPPKMEEILIDEISHSSNIEADWLSCIKDNEFLAGRILSSWRNHKGSIPPEITLKVYKRVSEKKNINQKDIASLVGKPELTEIKESVNTKTYSIERWFPTVVGNANFNEYNKNILSQIATYEDVEKIAIKRTVGMGDVILVEPVLRYFRNKYKNAQIDLFTAKKDIVAYFETKPDNVIEIDQDKLLVDYLNDKKYNLKFDLDLSYESRARTSFIDSYLETCGVDYRKYRYDDKQVHLISDAEKIEKRAIVCADGSGWPGKSWGINKYAEVIKYLQSEGWEVIEIGHETTNLTDEKYHNCDLNTLIETIASASLYVGTDNGPMHIARSFNVPCIIIAGAALPYYTSPNREYIYYLENSNSPSFGCKHTTFFSIKNDSLTFIPQPEDDPTSGLSSIEPSHFIEAYRKMFKKELELKFYFNTPYCSYYINEHIDYIRKEDMYDHPDQNKNISDDYAPRWKEMYEKYAQPWVNNILNYKKEGKLLDIGCNIGCTVLAAQRAGFEAFGVDINAPSIEKGKELFPEINGNLFFHYDYDLNNQIFDIITSDQTWEHVESPINFLLKIKNILKDDGLIFIGIPNFRSKEAMQEFQNWGQVGTGEHTLLPTPGAVDYFMKTAELDYSIEYREGGMFIIARKVNKND